MNLSEAAAAQAAGATVRAELLAEFLFTSETVRLWNGFGDLPTNDGKVWKGTGSLASISPISQSVNGVAPPLTLTLSGVDSTFALKAKAEKDEYYNRPVLIYIQFFSENWQCLDNPYSLTMSRMTGITSDMEPSQDGSGRRYSVSITAETPFAVRRRPKYGYLTDRDQQMRYPGDKGLERTAGIDNKYITFPAF